jgi:hypothetical protein
MSMASAITKTWWEQSHDQPVRNLPVARRMPDIRRHHLCRARPRRRRRHGIAGGRTASQCGTRGHPQQNSRVEELLENRARPPPLQQYATPAAEPNNGADDTDLSDKRPTGIVTAPGRQIAIFAVKDAKPLILAEGETISGWRIETIGPIEVSLIGPGGSRTLRPKPDPTLAQPFGAGPAASGVQPPAPLPRPVRAEARR